jgi:hypothetical protein
MLTLEKEIFDMCGSLVFRTWGPTETKLTEYFTKFRYEKFNNLLN